MTKRSLCGIALAVTTLLGAPATIGWACVPLRSVVTLSPRASGPPGMAVQVSGAGFGESRIEIRWNALDGPELASATGPDFVTPMRVPESSAGLYDVVVVARAKDGGIDSADHASFLVTPATDAGATGEPVDQETNDTPGLGMPPAPEASDTPSWLLATVVAFLAGLAASSLWRRRRALVESRAGPGVGEDQAATVV